jgi:hypothetical protein
MSANHLTGVDESVTILVNGLTLYEIDTVTSFTCEDDVTDISFRPLGRSGTIKSQDFGGHNGTLVFVDSRAIYEDLKQTIFTAMTARIPSAVTLVHVVNHKPGGVDQRVYTYRDVQITGSRSVARDQVTEVTITWSTGSLRSVS